MGIFPINNNSSDLVGGGILIVMGGKEPLFVGNSVLTQKVVYN
jgi:hypothetical protein